jgi:hypothetical protein
VRDVYPSSPCLKTDPHTPIRSIVKKIFILVAFALTVQSTVGQQIFNEGFDTSNGIITWKNVNPFIGGSTPFIDGSGTLTYSGYHTSSGTDGSLALNQNSGGISHAAFYTFGTNVYASFLVRVQNAPTSDNLVMNFIGSPAVPLNDYGFVLKDNGAGSLKFGLKVNGTSTYAGSDYTYGSTYLIVVKYSNLSKTYSLFVNPSLGAEPAPTLTSASHNGSGAAFISEVQFNQYNILSANVDELRVFSLWSDMLYNSSGSSVLVSDPFPDFNMTGWNEFSCCNSLNANSPGLTYSSYGSGHAVYASGGSGYFIKPFATVSSGMIYVSFLFKEQSTSSNTVYSNLNFFSFGQSTWNNQQGFVMNNNIASLKTGDLSANVTGGPSVSGTHFYVLGYNTSTGQYSLWVDTGFGTSTPPGPTITGVTSVVTAVDGVAIMNQGNDNPVYDEIRVSTNWADVASSTGPDPVSPRDLTLNGSINGSFNVAPATTYGYLVVRGDNTPPTFQPVDGINYSTGQQGSDRIVLDGTQSSFSDSFSNSGETAYYTVYAYLNDGSHNYNLNDPAMEAYTLDPATNANFNSPTIAETSINLTWGSLPTNCDGVIVMRASNGNFPDSPFDGQLYTMGSTYFNTTVAYIGNATSFNDTGLTENTQYNYAIYTYAGTGPFIKYNNSGGSSNYTTLKAEPTASPLNLQFTGYTDNSIFSQWTSGGGGEDGYVLIYKVGSSPVNGAVVDGTIYSFGQSVGGGTVGYIGSSPFANLNTLIPNTQYFFDIYAYTYSPNTNYYNYRQVTPLEGSQFTFATEPGNPNTLTFPTTTNNSLGLQFVSNGSTGYIILRRALFSPDVDPVDATTYTVGSALGSSVVIAAGSAVTMTDVGLAPGTIYFYKIFAYNGSGASLNYSFSSLQGSRITAPANPTAALATSVGQTSFVASWDSPSTTTSFRLDVSTSPGFGTFVSPYQDLTVATTSTTVTGLTAGTTYYYRVRAVSSTGTSGNSNVVTALTAPANPVASAATVLTQSSFTANWGASPTANAYFLDVSTSNVFSSFVVQNVAVGNILSSVVNTSITPGTIYYYRVRASNGATSGNSNTISLTTVPPNPTATAATSMTATSFNANWAAATTATGYQLDVSTGNTFVSFVSGYNSLAVAGGSTVTQSVSGLTAGTTYFYRLRAISASGTSGNSSVITVLTTPAAPVASAATGVGATGFNATWAAATSATSYRLDVATNSGFVGGTFVSGYQDVDVGNVLTAAVNGLTDGTTYYYRVRGVNASGASVSSNTITTITAPPAPVASAATTITQTSFSANWSVAASATGYRVDVSTDPVFGSFVGIYNNLSAGNVTTLSISSLTAGTTYYYRVRATSAAGTSPNSSSISTVTIPPNPVIGSATAIGQTTFNANWSAAASATGYRLDVATNSAFTGGTFVPGYQDLAVANVTTFTINSSLSAGTTYFYRVRAVNTSGTSGSSGNGTVTTAPPNPVASAATSITQTSFTANWAAATTATGYFVDVATDAGFTSLVSGYSNLSVGNVLALVVNSNLTAGTIYFYRVRASSANGTSGNSNAISATTIPPNPVATSAGSFAPAAFTANWAAATGATSYRLDVATTNVFTGGTFVTGYQDLNVGNVTSYNVNTNLAAGTTYFYRLRAANGSGTSSSSNVVTTLTLAAAPVATAASGATQTSMIAHWNASTSATSYVIDVSPDNFITFVTGFHGMNAGNVTSVAVNGLSGGVTYSYRVRAVNASGESPNSNTVTQITIPGAPQTSAAKGITTSSFVAVWYTSKGAGSYRLDVSTDNFTTYIPGFSNLSVSSPDTTASVTGLTEGVVYKYQVRAVNAAGTSPNSGTTSVVTVPPVPTVIAATDITTTTFTANWTAVDGATQYLLDVSTDDFTTFVTGYSNKATVAISDALTGLTPNTTYKYRVRATSSSGTSANSNVIAVTTYATAPAATAATAMTQAGFTANWNAVAGVTSYELDVSTDDFSTTLTGYTALIVSATSKPVTALTTGTTYKYRVRSVNGTGSSINSNVVSISTIPATPVANNATLIAQKGFTVSWTSVTGATDYVLDLSTAPDFSTFQAGYSAKSETSASEAVTGLLAGTTYYYRVRSRNASGESPSSNSISQITIPDNPSATIVSSDKINNTSFIAVWEPVTGADSYELDVSLFSSNFNTFVTGYENHSVTGNDNTEEIVVALTPGTAYRYRVRAVNAGGKSGNSNARSVQTNGGNVGEFGVTATPASTQFAGTAINVTGAVANSTGVVTAILSYQGIAQATAVQTKPIDVVNGGYTVSIDDTMLDELGVQFTVTAEDELGKKKTTDLQKIYRSFIGSGSPVVLNGSFAGDRSSIRIISIPYDLKDNLIESIFVSLGTYDKKSWRLAHYQDGENVEYGDRLNKIERGLGYWFNAKGTVSAIKTGEGVAPRNDSSTPFTLSLAAGWNQIGNPFPFAIDWSDVLADNPSVSGVSTLKVYASDKQNFDNGNKIEVFGGGFVHADNAATLNLKVSLKNTANGSRIQRSSPDLGNDTWELPLSVRQKSSEYDISGIGMSPQASMGKDDSDEIRPPRLDEFLDMTFDHPESKFRYFTKDILPTSNEGTWEFYVQSSGKDEDGMLMWENSHFGSNVAKIYLLDLASLRMIDMRTEDHYSFLNPGRKEFKIYYRKDGREISPDLLLAGTPYPNPSSGSVTMSVALPDGEGLFNMELVAFDMLGRQIHSVRRDLPAGIHNLSWDGNDSSGNRVKGLYVLRARVNNNWLGQSYRVVIE